MASRKVRVTGMSDVEAGVVGRKCWISIANVEASIVGIVKACRRVKRSTLSLRLKDEADPIEVYGFK
jgi:hypothetical protein